MKSQKILIAILLIIIIVLSVILYRSTPNVSGKDFIEVIAKGIVVGNNLENSEIGSYIHLRQQTTNDDLFVIYKPLINGKQVECLNSIDVSGISVKPSTVVEVRGKYLSKVNGQPPTSLMISTCESLTSYIKVIK